MNCNICGVKSEERFCNNCSYLLKHGSTEEEVKSMLSDKRSRKIWRDNEEIAKRLADVYYKSLIEDYKLPKKTTREEFGYNTFLDGIKTGLDIVLPMLNDLGINQIKKKINSMIKKRNKLRCGGR